MTIQIEGLIANDDIEFALGRPLSEKELTTAPFQIARVSEIIRNYCGREFTDKTYKHECYVSHGELQLIELPVFVIFEVTNHKNEVIEFDFQNDIQKCFIKDEYNNLSLKAHYHGNKDGVPVGVKLVALDIILRNFGSEEIPIGLTSLQETAGSVSTQMSFATWAQMGRIFLTPANKVELDKYKPPRFAVRV